MTTCQVYVIGTAEEIKGWSWAQDENYRLFKQRIATVVAESMPRINTTECRVGVSDAAKLSRTIESKRELFFERQRYKLGSEIR
jgi:hypothetical protein